jgi:energy-coupling factor transporter ATP-binding protein EcfA2
MVHQNHIDALIPHFALNSVELLLHLSTTGLSLLACQERLDTHQTTRAESISELDARAHLGKFGISGDLALQPIGSLSGGQKARLSLSCILLKRPHVLLFDEPSNHLSIGAIEALIVAMREFSGAIVVVSHNQHLLSLVCNEIFIVDNGRIDISRAGSAPLSSGSASSSGSNKKGDIGLSKIGGVDGRSGSTFTELLSAYVQSLLSK